MTEVSRMRWHAFQPVFPHIRSEVIVLLEFLRFLRAYVCEFPQICGGCVLVYFTFPRICSAYNFEFPRTCIACT